MCKHSLRSVDSFLLHLSVHQGHMNLLCYQDYGILEKKCPRKRWKQRTRGNTERNRETFKKGVDEKVAVEESEDDRENARFDPGESCANVRLQEIENILQIRELLCISFKSGHGGNQSDENLLY